MNNERWSQIRTMLLDPSQWWELRQMVGMDVVDGEELDHPRACTGVMPDTLECRYICANAGADFWKWNYDVSLVTVVAQRMKLWRSLDYVEPCGEEGSCLDQRGANLRDTDLIGADLIGASLIGADLRDADLRCAELNCADLRWSDLRWADLNRADLRGADLRWAELRGADLAGADLRGANLFGADLKEADLSDADLSKAKYNKSTVFPEGFDPVAAGMEVSE